MFKGFKEFLMRGNVIDLAVAVVIGAAFGAVVDRVVEALINPVVGMVFSADSLDTALVVDLPGGGALRFGMIIGAVLNFVIVAAVVYFVFVLPMNTLRTRMQQEEEVAAVTEQELLVEIRDLLREQNAARGIPLSETVGADPASEARAAATDGSAGPDADGTAPRHA